MHDPWLLVQIETIARSPSLPMYVWRALRGLGAHYMHASVCVLPESAATVAALNRLVGRARRRGAELRIFHVAMATEDEHRALVERFSAERDDEYAEVVARTRAFLAGIEKERRRGRAIFTEVEESRADLTRLERWLDAVRQRDYFDAPGYAAAASAVKECKSALTDFEAEAYSHETAAASAEKPLVHPRRPPSEGGPRPPG
jgi:nucleotide-binding universal stress UspA family protein